MTRDQHNYVGELQETDFDWNTVQRRHYVHSTSMMDVYHVGLLSACRTRGSQRSCQQHSSATFVADRREYTARDTSGPS